MKKGVLLLLLFSIFLISFVIAQDEVTQSVDDKAYTCLNNQFNKTGCEGLSTEGKIFALLTLGKCSDEIISDSNYMSNIKLTSQAILALDKVGIDITNATNWLWAQNKTSTDMDWYLQIDSTEATVCTITHGTSTNIIELGEDKKIISNIGPSCLSNGDVYGTYWLKISPNCYNQEFETSCDENFLTTLLFKDPSENTIHISSETHSGSAGGYAEPEKIEFLCFKKGTSCNYEGTLWATLVLDYLSTSQDITPIKFYLTTLYDSYTQYFPEAFLYRLTGTDEFRDKLVDSQSQEGSWRVGNDKYYDTALALLAVPTESNQYSDAIAWLEKNQIDTGCWSSNNFLDTAFIVYSVWPRGVSLSGAEDSGDGEIVSSTEGESCEDVGYFCMPGISCEGYILDEYDCGFDNCCSQEQVLETCSDSNGDICNSNQQCVGGSSESTFDLTYGQTCCVGGACEEKTVAEAFTCESSGGVCRIEGCETNEESSFDTCEFGDTCCVEKTTQEANYLWLWILVFLVLIALVSIGIVKRDKLREYWFRLKSNFKKSPPSAPGRGRPFGRPVTPAASQRRLMQGRPSQARRPAVRRPSRIARPSSKAPSEINDVLKKLKDMGK